MRYLIGVCLLLGTSLLVARRWHQHQAEADERALDVLASRPSITRLGSKTQLRAVTLRFSGGLASISPSYEIRFTDDDRFAYQGWRDVPVLGPRQGPLEFAVLANWLDNQPVSGIGRRRLDGGMDTPSFEILIERYDTYAVTICGSDPPEDLEVWGILKALQGATLSALAEPNPASTRQHTNFLQ